MKNWWFGSCNVLKKCGEFVCWLSGDEILNFCCLYGSALIQTLEKVFENYSNDSSMDFTVEYTADIHTVNPS